MNLNAVTQVPINIVIADNDELFRDGFRTLIINNPSLNLLAEAPSIKRLKVISRNLKPDVIFTNIDMHGREGILETKLFIKSIQSKVITLSLCQEQELLVDILETGAMGFIQKNSPKQEILAAVNAVYRNEKYYCRNTEKLLAVMAKNGNFNPGVKKEIIDFSENELKVIRLICSELSNKEIAEILLLSKRTIEGYRESILDKTKSKNTAGIVVYAIKHKIFELNNSEKQKVKDP